MNCDEKCLMLAHHNLKSVPRSLVNSYKDMARSLDVSNNQISDVSFLKSFTCLTSIILDHNIIMSEVVFPYLPTVKVLWINYNHIYSYANFIKNLRSSFPNLRQLSLMNNAGIPRCHEDTYYQYLRYRLYVISYFDDLEYLDDRAVSKHEKEEALRLFGSPIFRKYVSKSIPKIFQSAANRIQEFIKPNFDERPYLI